jgi:hypothetical protein
MSEGWPWYSDKLIAAKNRERLRVLRTEDLRRQIVRCRGGGA